LFFIIAWLGRSSLSLSMAKRSHSMVPMPPPSVPPAHLRSSRAADRGGGSHSSGIGGSGPASGVPKRGDRVARILASLDTHSAPKPEYQAPTAKKSSSVAWRPAAVDDDDDDYEPTVVADSSIAGDEIIILDAEVHTPPYVESDDDGYGDAVKTEDNDEYGDGYGNTVKTEIKDDEYGDDGYGNVKTEVKDEEYGDGYGNTVKTEDKDEYGMGYGNTTKTEVKDESDDDGYGNVKTEIKDEYGDGYGNDEDNDNDEYGMGYGNVKTEDDEYGGYGNTVRTDDEYGGYGNTDDEYGDADHGDDISHYTEHMPWGSTRKLNLELALSQLRAMTQPELAEHFKQLGYGKLKGIGWFWKPGADVWAFRHSKKRGGGQSRRMQQQQQQQSRSSTDRRMQQQQQQQQSRSSTDNPDLVDAPWRVGSR
jgi:hypothetical protein